MSENQDTNNTPQPGNQGGGNVVQKGVQKAQKAKQTIERMKKVANAIKNISSSGPLMYVLFWVFVVIVAIIILTGIIMFFITMPGMVMDKLKSLFKEMGNYIAAFFGADTTQQIDDVRVYETLDYIEDMGWDLKGEGFLTGFYETGDEATVKSKLDGDDKDNFSIDDKQGVVRNGDGDIILADSDFIFTYIMSDNYVYTLKNDNLATQSDHKDAGWFSKLVTAVSTAMYKIKNLTLGPIFDAIGLTDAVMDKWGKGLIGIYYDNGLGVEKHAVNTGSIWNFDTIEINTDKKTLSVARNELFNANNNAIEYSLDGWTGRYGMPLEFLLSVHKATMMPDLAFDMVTTFPTEIHLLLHESSGESRAGYKTPSGYYVDWYSIQKTLTNIETDEGWTWLRNWFADFLIWFRGNGAKVEAAKKCGVDVGTGTGECTCTFTDGEGDSEGYAIYKDGNKYKYSAEGPITGQNEDGTYIRHHEKDEEYSGTRKKINVVDEPCERCVQIYKGIAKYLGDNTDYNYITYSPYISKVTDHWYRDVYFVLNSSTEFVDYDYDYEAVMKERWTLYETYPDDPSDPIYNTLNVGYNDVKDKIGEFIIYRIDENGKYKKENGKYVVYTGTFDEARGGTLYVLGDNGDYVIYSGVVDNQGKAKDADGNEIKLYLKEGKDANGADAFKEYSKGDTIAVAKKAVTVDASDTNTLKDLGWEKSGGIWTAYDEVSTSSGFERIFPDEEITEERESNEIYRLVMSKCYINLNLTNNIVQVGEGQRTETNPDIKKMFLTNKYFRYDGSTETAEIITALRKQGSDNKDDDIKYGALDEDELEKTVTIDGKTYKASDYAGTVLLNQDSLNAFSMLENTHTLDADFIYRDFKELVVELGYFEKEEITDETPRLLQFPVPEIGSLGYPDRTIDKREVIEGTMIHSKHDIEANKKYTLKAIVLNATNAGAANDGNVANVEVNTNRFNKPVTLAASRVNNDRLQLNSLEFNTTEVGAVVDGGTKRPEQVPLRKFLEETEEMCKFIDEKGYNYCVLRKPPDCATCSEKCKNEWTTNWSCIKHDGPDACTCTEVHCDHQVYKRDACGLSASFVDSQLNPTSRYDTCCNYLVSWALQNVGVLKIGQTLAISTMYQWALEDLGGTEIKKGEALKPGDILFYDDFGHVDLVAEKNGSSYLKFNGGHYIETGAQRGTGKSSVNEFGGWSGSRPPEHVVRLNWGNSEDGPYKGFLGNEAVTSPVTGILMDYGTYPIDKNVDDDGDGQMDKEERINVDLKYGPSINIEPNVNQPADGAAAGNAIDLDVEKRDWADEVGYATIFVLNKEVFEMLDESINHRWRNVTNPVNNSGEGLISPNGQFYDMVTTEDQLEDLTEDESDLLDETVYGYKEFAETYERFGIAGYFVYIDGFKCELPDTSFIDSDDDKDLNDESGNPSGKALTFDTFKNVGTNVTADNELIQSLYVAEAAYNMASKKATEKLNVEETIKIDSYPVLTISNPKSYEPLNSLEKLVFIKEGTVLGRTFTDKELVEQRLANGDDSKYNFEYYAPSQEVLDENGKKQNVDKVVGNYITVKLLDPNKPIENVEDYMKIDKQRKAGNQEYQFREGDLEILADAIHHEGCGSYCASLLGTNIPDDKLYLSKSVGFTIINKLNTDSGFIPDYNNPSKLWDSSKSPLYNLVCRIPTGYDTGGYTTGTTGGWYAIALGLRKRIDADNLDYCDICFEAAEYIRDNDSTNMTCNGKFGAEFSAGEAMPHTMWQQGAGYHGEKIWVYIDKNKNGKKDTECVDSGDFYLYDTAN